MRAMSKVSRSKEEKGMLQGEPQAASQCQKKSDVGNSAKLQFEESGVYLRLKLSQQLQDNG